jgi:hypothetical protein
MSNNISKVTYFYIDTYLSTLFQDTKFARYRAYYEEEYSYDLSSPLMSINNVRDSFVYYRDALYVERFCKEVLLDNTLTWEIYQDYSNYLVFKCSSFEVTDVECNILETFNPEDIESGIQGLVIIDNSLCLSINKMYLLSNDLDGLYTWLNTRKPIILYSNLYPEYEYLGDLTYYNIQDNSNISVLSDIYPYLESSPTVINTYHLENNTTYYVKFTSSNNTVLKVDLGGTKQELEVVKGYNEFELTTSTIEHNNLIIDAKGIYISDLVVSTTNIKDIDKAQYVGSNGEVIIAVHNSPIQFGKGGKLK